MPGPAKDLRGWEGETPIHDIRRTHKIRFKELAEITGVAEKTLHRWQEAGVTLNMDKILTERTFPEYVGLKAIEKCACGHARRVHASKILPTGKRENFGQCLAGTPQAPMSCECPEYSK